jgi:hypothetical protein
MIGVGARPFLEQEKEGARKEESKDVKILVSKI